MPDNFNDTLRHSKDSYPLLNDTFNQKFLLPNVIGVGDTQME